MINRKAGVAFCPTAIGLLVCIQADRSLGQQSANATYTTNTQFSTGTLYNLQNTADQLQINPPVHGMFPYVNIACSGRGTAVRIYIGSDSNDPPYVVGEYYTSPANMGRDPSRTTVDHLGNFWVTNRGEGGVSGGVVKGSVTRVALAMWNPTDSATFIDHVSPDGHSIYLKNPANLPDPSKLYLSLPFSRLDRDGDGFIRTSKGLGHILNWSNANNADKDGGGTPGNPWGVNTADDELIANYTRVDGTAARTMAIDLENNLWTGGNSNGMYQKLDGTTGLPFSPNIGFTTTCGSTNNGGYGGLIDHFGQLWSVQRQNTLFRYTAQAQSPVQTCFDEWSNYGIAIDPLTGHIWESTFQGSYLYEIDPETETGEPLHTYSQGLGSAQGIAVDGKGHVWVAEAHGDSVYHLAPDPNTGGHYPLGAVTGFNGCTGVAVDANGKIWVSEDSGYASRIDPNPDSQTADANGNKLGIREAITGVLPVPLNYTDQQYPSSPYNYSDMTGFVAQQPTWQGKWTVVHDGGVTNGTWDRIEWNTESSYQPDPVRAPLIVRIRTADTQEGLSAVRYEVVRSGDHLCHVAGRFMQVEVQFKGNNSDPSGFLTPILYDLHIIGYDPADDIDPENGIPDACERIIYVKQGATGQNNGRTWADAYSSLHDGLAELRGNAAPATQVWVAAGTYSPGPSYADHFLLVPRRRVFGGFSGDQGTERRFDLRSPAAYPTIISGAAGSNCLLVKAVGGDETTVFDGFTLTGAWGYCSNAPNVAMLLDSASPTISRCRFTGNSSGYSAGAMAIRNGSGPKISRCAFELNQGVQGGAIAIDEASSPQFVGCLFVGNRATNGGAVSNSNNCQAVLINCTVAGNVADSQGGGIWNGELGGALTLQNCILWDNWAAGVTGQAAQVYNPSWNSTFRSCVQGYGGPSANGNTGAYPSPIRLPYFGPDGVWGGGDDDLGNLRLRRGSICIDGGDSSFVPGDIATDLDDQPRIVAVAVDMGAYEVDPGTDDCNGDGVLDSLQIGQPSCGYGATGICTDCDDNEVLDECETDANSSLDFDHNCAVDLIDYAMLECCLLTGVPGQLVGQQCRPEDATGDLTVDMLDINVFVAGATGPGIFPYRPGFGASPPPPDTDGDGIVDPVDNCPAVANPDQLDTDGDLIGDACDPDVDGDGAANEVDNCPWYNPDQTDADEDGVGDFCDCDTCPTVANPLVTYNTGDSADECAVTMGLLRADGTWQGDFDCDWVGNTCDNCPAVYNPWQDDDDGDGVGNECDNCPFVQNSDQADIDENGIGDACEGEGLQGLMVLGDDPLLGFADYTGGTPVPHQASEAMTLPQDSSGAASPADSGLPVPEQGAAAYFVTHGGTAQSASVPASGGTIVVDLIVATAAPIGSWDVLPAMDAANVASIDATGWTAEAELLSWAYEAFGVGQAPPAAPASYYNCGLADWRVYNAQSQVICRSTAEEAACATRSLEPGAMTYSGLPGMTAAGGPIGVPVDGAFAAQASLGATTSGRMTTGAFRVATLTLDVAAAHGTYHLSCQYGSYALAGANDSSQMTPGPVFEIRVGQD